jgi:hypothetical protein
MFAFGKEKLKKFSKTNSAFLAKKKRDTKFGKGMKKNKVFDNYTVLPDTTITKINYSL